MAKNRKNRPRATRKARSRARRGGRRINGNRIPLLPFNRQMMNTVIRGSHTMQFEDGKMFPVIFSMHNILTAYPAIFKAFREIKLLKVRVWLQLTVSAVSPGLITMVVAPKAEVLKNANNYDELSATPGAVSGRPSTTLHGVYFPTEPSERDWFNEQDAKDKIFFMLQFMSKGVPKSNTINPSLDMQIIWDAHIKARGLSALEPSTWDTDKIDVPFEVVQDMPTQEMSRCKM